MAKLKLKMSMLGVHENADQLALWNSKLLMAIQLLKILRNNLTIFMKFEICYIRSKIYMPIIS